MPSLRFPDTGTRYVLLPSGKPAVNARAYLYADDSLTTPAEVYYDVDGVLGPPVPLDEDGRRWVTLNAYGEQPDYWGPADGTEKLWVVVNGVPSVVHADYNARINTAAAQASYAAGVVGGLGSAASRSVGTTAGTVAAGDDARITGASQKASNLADLTNAATARTNLGLGNVDNTSDASKPISTATQTALNAKAPTASPTFTGTVSGVTKGHVGLGNVDNTADTAKPVSVAQLAAIETFGVRANDTRFGTPGTRAAFINAMDAAEAKGNNSVLYIPAGMTIDVGDGLSMAGRTVQIVGAGAGLSGATPLASVIKASTQTGPVLDYTGYVDPSNFMAKIVPLSGVMIKGSNVADPTKNNAGLRFKSLQSCTIRDIAIMHTGGPCMEFVESPGDAVYLCDFERIVMTTPVNAGANDVPYFYANECNGNRFYGFGFRSLTTTNNVGASGAAIIESNKTTVAIPGSPWAPRYNILDAWWYEYLHPGPGGTLLALAGNTNIIRDFTYFDVKMESGAQGTGTSYVRLQSAAPALNLGGNIVRGIIPGDQNVTTFMDTGIDVRQSGNRIEGVKGYRGKNVTIASGVDYTYVHLGGAESGGTGASGFVINSAATHNVLIDEVNGDEWRNGGWVRQNGISTESGGAPNIQTFTSSGTWTKPAGAATVQITAIGAGGGGGSGRRGADGTACSGGGGGAGGAIVTVTLPASALSATHTVSVGSGGAGGPAVTTDDTNGSAGTAGGNCVVSGLLVAYGGLAGGGGNNSTGQAGSSLAPATANGGFGNTIAGGAAGNAVNGAFGGAGGGGINTSNVAANGGAQGYFTYAQGVGSGSAGVVDGAAAGSGSNVPAGSPLPGGGAGGGAASVTTAAGTGGGGGRYGCGGGGGGASRNGNNSGAGGAGANGIVQIITTF
ncbi:glycine-rich domain-containing protein [Micromonospora sediminicola]|uniref:glycine-rich domain-containing protein n=1 Tax=Micromonospora sediminicola TaxID=946078 RepID=UPI0037AE726C